MGEKGTVKTSSIPAHGEQEVEGPSSRKRINHLQTAREVKEKLPFSVEQPASPKEYKPEVVSFYIYIYI